MATNFALDSEVVTQDDVNALLLSLAPDAVVDDEYEHFLAPGYDQIKNLVAKYWDSSWINYGFLSQDFPLCYDFAELCAAAVRTGAIKENLKYRIAFGTLRYSMNSGDRHAICFVVLSNCQVKYFEPQNAEVRWMDTPRDLKSLDCFYI